MASYVMYLVVERPSQRFSAHSCTLAEYRVRIRLPSNNRIFVALMSISNLAERLQAVACLETV